MSKDLEKLLEEYSAREPIENDGALVGALSRIIDTESAKDPRAMDTELIDEAVSFLASLTSPQYDPEPDAARVCEGFMKSIPHRNEKRKPTLQSFLKGKKSTLQRVAVLVAVITATASVLGSVNSEAAASVFKSVISYFKSAVLITPSGTPQESETLEPSIPLAVPEGFRVTEEKREEETHFIHLKNSGGDFVIIEIRPTNPAGVIHGTEGVTYSEIKLGEHTGYMFYSESERKGSVILGDARTTVTVSGICDSDVLLQLARGLVE